jgi:glycosyltransferase involved in cell wall biosynthesis
MISESPKLHTGFGRVTREVAKYLSSQDDIDLTVLGWRFSEATVDFDFPVLHSEGLSWDLTKIDQTIDDLAPDTVIVSGHATEIASVAESRHRSMVNLIGYCFFEGESLHSKLKKRLDKFDKIIVPSYWASTEVVSDVIPLGVDPAFFHPLSNKKEIKKEFGLEDEFVIGYVGRNQFRKQLPILFEAFSILYSHKSYEDCRLLLVTDPKDAAGWDLEELTEEYKLSGKVAILDSPYAFSDKFLCRAYNAMDIMISPSMGESFGLTLLEAMACGTPIMATDCSAVSGLLPKRAQLIPAAHTLILPWDNSKYSLADLNKLLEMLDLVYFNRDILVNWSYEGIEKAKDMTWNSCGQKWHELIASLSTENDMEVRAVVL